MAEKIKSSWKWRYFVAGALISTVWVLVDRLAGFDKLPLAEEFLIALGMGAVLGLIVGAVLRYKKKAAA